MKQAAILMAAFGLSSCGPDLAQVRKTVAASPYRSLAFFPLDFRRGQKDFAGPATAAVEAKLRRDGFALSDSRKTRDSYARSTLKGRVPEETAQAAILARALGAKAALVGVVEDDYERVERRAPVYRYDPVAPPACCFQSPPCPGHQAYDPMTKSQINSCGQRHRQVLLEPGSSVRVSGLTLRLRLVDAATGAVVWEQAYSAARDFGVLADAADAAAEMLTGQLVDALAPKGS